MDETTHIRTISERISELLVSKQIYPNVRGYRYLKDAIAMCYFDFGKLHGIGNNVYKTIATVYGSTPKAVERCIRYAIGKERYCIHSSNSLFIATAVEQLILEDQVNKERGN